MRIKFTLFNVYSIFYIIKQYTSAMVEIYLTKLKNCRKSH